MEGRPTTHSDVVIVTSDENGAVTTTVPVATTTMEVTKTTTICSEEVCSTLTETTTLTDCTGTICYISETDKVFTLTICETTTPVTYTTTVCETDAEGSVATHTIVICETTDAEGETHTSTIQEIEGKPVHTVQPEPSVQERHIPQTVAGKATRIVDDHIASAHSSAVLEVKPLATLGVEAAPNENGTLQTVAGVSVTAEQIHQTDAGHIGSTDEHQPDITADIESIYVSSEITPKSISKFEGSGAVLRLGVEVVLPLALLFF